MMKKRDRIYLSVLIIDIFIIYKYHKIIIKKQKEFINQFVSTLIEIIDLKDHYTKEHCCRVAFYCCKLANKMGLSSSQQEEVFYAALLHDIGKLGIPNSILNKSDPLNDYEKCIMKQHVLIGEKILDHFQEMKHLKKYIKYHHERYDGSGYYYGKKAKEIPLVSRIIAVGDAYDAMNSNRCYRLALCQKKIIDELTEGCFHQFDGEIVQYMIEMIQKGEI